MLPAHLTALWTTLYWILLGPVGVFFQREAWIAGLVLLTLADVYDVMQDWDGDSY
jgi:hypothetical protein